MGKRRTWLFSSLPFDIVLEVLATKIKKEKEEIKLYLQT